MDGKDIGGNFAICKERFCRTNMRATVVWKELHIYRYFRQFFDNNLLEKICRETVTYAMRKGHSIECSPDDLMKYVAILLLSGYIPVKHRRMLETRADAHNSLVSSAMTRNIFEEIHRFSHLNDNSKKWYWPHIRFCINSAVVNAWISYRHVDKNMPLL